MKRYELMSKEDIIDTYVPGCDNCRLKDGICQNYSNYLYCEDRVKAWLKDDVKTMKVYRFQTIKTAEEMLAAYDMWISYTDDETFADYLLEIVEVIDE